MLLRRLWPQAFQKILTPFKETTPSDRVLTVRLLKIEPSTLIIRLSHLHKATKLENT